MLDLCFATRRWNWDLLSEVQMWCRAEVISPPPWLFATQICPPPQYVVVPRPGEIVYPEDKLRRKWLKRHSEASNIRWKSTYVGEHQYWQHPANNFAERQLVYMRRGHTEKEACDIVEGEDKRAQRLRDLERWIAIEQMDEMFPGASELLQPKTHTELPTLELEANQHAVLLRELVEEMKLRGVVTPLDPSLIPEGMDLAELLAFMREFPEHVHYFNIPLLATYMYSYDYAPLGDALMYIYGGDNEEEIAPYRQQLRKLSTVVAEAEARGEEDLKKETMVSEDGMLEHPDLAVYRLASDDSRGGSTARAMDRLLNEENPEDQYHDVLEELLDDFYDGTVDYEDQKVLDKLMGPPTNRGEEDKLRVEREMLRMQRVVSRLRKLPRLHAMAPVKTPVWRLLNNILALRPRRPMTPEELIEARKALDLAKQRAQELYEEQDRQERAQRRAALQQQNEAKRLAKQKQKQMQKETPIIE